MKANPTASVVIPVFNEQENLPELLERSLKACRSLTAPFEIILVDDGSRDRSPEMLREAAEKHPGEIIAVLLNRNYGQHSAVMAGFAHAKGDVIITLDADLQNPPEEIPNLYRKLVDEDLDVVAGIRVPREDSFLRKLPSWCVNRITQKVTGVKMHDYGAGCARDAAMHRAQHVHPGARQQLCQAHGGDRGQARRPQSWHI